MALSVLVFHYDKWLTGIWDAASIQGRLGVYAVSIFFVLSGLTLTLVYESRLDETPQSWAAFFKKRFLRIFPLLWLASAATLLLDDVSRPAGLIFLNFSGLFGFINPVHDIATGSWSIGCELVFYVAFPTLSLLARKTRAGFLGVFVLLFAFAVWAAFRWFSPAKSSQQDWWEAYVQAANHAFFFAGGMAMGVFRNEMAKIPRLGWFLLLLLAAISFVVWPVGSEAYHLVSGWNRVVFSCLSLLVVAAFFNCNIELTGFPHKALAWLGAVSYSLYLLHPLVFRAVRAAIEKFGLPDGYWPLFLLALIGSLVLSCFSYYFFEKPILNVFRH